MTTVNAVEMLKSKIRIHGRPKLIITDVGPAFRGDYLQQLQDMHINHSYSEAYMPARNSHAERSVGVVQKMLVLILLANDK